jgi:uncharacterized coiled-coil DUF342 family protein
MATLYELTSDYIKLLELAEDPDIEEDVFRDTLEGIAGAIEDKAEAYAIIIGELLAKADRITNEAKRLNAWADSLTKHADRMKETLMYSMDEIGTKKIETEHFRIGIAGNGGKKPLKITAEVPDQYMVMKPEVDTKKIREALEAGEQLDFAYLADRGRHLNIK